MKSSRLFLRVGTRNAQFITQFDENKTAAKILFLSSTCIDLCRRTRFCSYRTRFSWPISSTCMALVQGLFYSFQANSVQGSYNDANHLLRHNSNFVYKLESTKRVFKVQLTRRFQSRQRKVFLSICVSSILFRTI